MVFPERLFEFYKYAIFAVFAVVIAQSFPESIAVFIPLNNLLTYAGIENVLASILVYSFIITSWIGYFLSISKNPHSESKLGTLRFALDLFTLYQFYYLIKLSSKIEYHGEIFSWVLPAIFMTFLVWDIVKYFELRHEPKRDKDDRRNRTLITILFLAALIIQSLIFNFVIPKLPPLLYDGNNVWNIIFILSSMIIVTLYRWRKRTTFRMKRRNLKK